MPPPQDGDLSQRTSVTVFFVGQLAHATDGFSDAQRIGGGGFGSVYKAVLPTGGAGTVVGTAYAAVKKLDASSMQGETEFLQEVQVLGGCRHENLLPLMGTLSGRVCASSPRSVVGHVKRGTSRHT